MGLYCRSLSLSTETILKYRDREKIKTIEIIDLQRGSKAREIYATISNLSTSAMTTTSYHVKSAETPM